MGWHINFITLLSDAISYLISEEVFPYCLSDTTNIEEIVSLRNQFMKILFFTSTI
jgi:hypothetical protein